MIALIEMMTLVLFIVIAGMSIAAILNCFITIVFIKIILWFLCMGGIFYGLCSLLNCLFTCKKW